MFLISRFLECLLVKTILENRRVILSLLEVNPDAKLLDCGCGDGELAMKVAEGIGTKRIYGIDIVEENIINAKARGIEVYQGDLNENFPFESETFDVILANQIIEHLSNTDGFIKEIHRVLKVGGYGIISTPNLAASHNILYLLVGKQPPIARVSDEVFVASWHPAKRNEKSIAPIEGPSHRRIFTLGALKELLKYYGFEVEKSISTGFYPLPAPLARVACLIDKRHAAYITIKARKR